MNRDAVPVVSLAIEEMGMRRNLWLVVVLIVVAAGCHDGREPVAATAPPTPAPPPLLYVGSPDRLAAVRPDSGAVVFRTTGTVAAPDWSRLWRAVPTATGTSVAVLDPRSGAVLASGEVGHPFVVQTVSADGRAVALAEPSEPASYPQLAQGRAATTLGIARLSKDGKSVTINQWTVARNVEPDAFFADGSLAVIDLTPAAAPTAYRVRRFEASNGRVVDIETDADTDMTGGSARTHIYSPDGSHLFTFYRVNDATGPRAFIHVLDLRHPSAHCVDLPAPFGSSGPSTTALATSPDGKHLYVADVSTGKIADVDVFQRKVLSVADTGAAESYGYASAASDGQHTLYLSNGESVWSVDLAVMARGRALVTPGNTVMALRMAPSGAAQLYAALPDKVAVVDLATGLIVRSIPAPWADVDTDPIQFLGPASPPLAAALSSFQCAC